MAHKMCRKLACEFTSVGKAPEKLCSLAVPADSDNAEVGGGIVVDVLEVLSGSGDKEYLSDKALCPEADRDGSDDVVYIKIVCDLVGIKKAADISAVSFIPAEPIHISRRIAYFFNKIRF